MEYVHAVMERNLAQSCQMRLPMIEFQTVFGSSLSARTDGLREMSRYNESVSTMGFEDERKERVQSTRKGSGCRRRADEEK